MINLIHRFAISSFLKRAKPAVQREYQLFNIETITVLPWIEKSSFNVRVRALVKAIACHQFSVELVGSLHYFAPRGFSAHVPRHCPLFSKRRFKELQIPNTAIRFISLFQNSPMNFYVKISFNVFIFIFFLEDYVISSREFPFVFSKIVRTNARAEVSPRDLM